MFGCCEKGDGSNMPDYTSTFKQQRLPAWQPTLTPKSVIPLVVFLALAFIPLGIVLLIASRGVIEFQYDYTSCTSLESGSLCALLRHNQSLMNEPCTCSINVTLEESFEGNVYFYYGLQGFYQNHRRYAKSRDDTQLFGTHKSATELNADCMPYRQITDNVTGNLIPIAPCGAIANSLFNDTFEIFSGTDAVPVLRTGIAWPTDHAARFNNPTPTDDLITAFANYEKPFFWQSRVEELGDSGSPSNQAYKNEALIVWMRSAAFSNFRKLYGRLDRTVVRYRNGLPSGSYTIRINYNYPVSAFGGKKRFVISTSSWMGRNKNDFLGIAYACVGLLCLVVALVFCIIHGQTRKQKLHSIHAQNSQEYKLARSKASSRRSIQGSP